jgi:hypothetical protein
MTVATLTDEQKRQRQSELIWRLGQCQKHRVWLKGAPPDKLDYRLERSSPDGTRAYRAEKEPIVKHDDLFPSTGDGCVLTCNAYDSLILNSTDMLIADVDFADDRFDPHASGLDDLGELMGRLYGLRALDNYLDRKCPYWAEVDPFAGGPEPFRFADLTYRVYRTFGGCRVICSSRPFPWKQEGWLALKFMRFIGTDRLYMQLCEKQKCYRARLTPKPWRDYSDYGHTCDLICQLGARPHATGRQLDLHDELTGATSSRDHDSYLA